MPDLQCSLRRIQGATCFSALDLKAGYHNIPLTKDAKKLTGFITQDGVYQWRRMPFGLQNAPAHFQRVVVAVVDRGDVQVVIYLDDIVVYGTDPRVVWEETKVVMERLSRAGFMINTRKCKFLVSSLKLLGYQVEDG